MDPIVIRTQARAAEPVVFHIDDDEYKFTPGKIAPVLMSIVDDADPMDTTRLLLKDWVFAGLSDDDAAKLRGRLMDPRDDLDIPDLMGLVEGLVEAVSGRPTPSLSG